MQTGAGEGSRITDAEFSEAGATIVAPPTRPGPPRWWSRSRSRSRPSTTSCASDQLLFTYLHLAADRPLTDRLLAAGTTSVAYETVQLPDRSLPLLAPMSEIAGRMAPLVGGYHLMRNEGGRGVLLGGVPGVTNGKVVVLGGGVAGMHAATIALGMRAEVTVIDLSLPTLRRLDTQFHGGVKTIASNAYNIAEAVTRRRSGHRLGADPRGQGPEAGHQRTGRPDARGFGARRHRGRPGRMFRGHPRDHPRRPDVHRARVGLLLRGEHARRRPAQSRPSR